MEIKDILCPTIVVWAFVAMFILTTKGGF